MDHTALLILDIQNDFTGENAKKPVLKSQVAPMIANMNALLNRKSNHDLTVIYIVNAYSKFDILNIFRNFSAIKGTEGADLDLRLQIISDHIFSKEKGNAFSNPNLDIFLRKNNIKHLYISGLYAEFCVWQTIKSALKKEYKVSVLTDCIASQNDLTRQKMIEKYRKFGIETLSSVEI
jgi:nicotinamidase-related amidase